MFTTGAGLALLVAAVMGLLVGAIVVGQTLYATTIDHLGEFGTLRAMGASAQFIRGVIYRQAILSAVLGYAVGLPLVLLVLYLARNAGPALLLPWPVIGIMFVLTLAMCVAAALVSIRKVTRLDPAAVFK
jgi:putative ABC transport system permease protein